MNTKNSDIITLREVIMNNKLKWLALLISVDITWGMMFVINDYLLDYLSPNIMVFLKLLAASILSLAFVLIRDKGIKINRKDLPKIAIIGLIAMCIYNTLEGIGIDLTSASVAALILATVPIFTALTDYILFKNKVNAWTIVGIFGSILGVTILTLGAEDAKIKATVLGLIVMVLAASLWALYIVNVKPIQKKYDPMVLVAMFTTSGMIGSLFTVIIAKPEKMEFNLSVFILILVSSAFGFVIAQYFYIKVIKHIKVTTVAVFENLIPVTSVVASFLIFGQMLNIIQSIGALIILTSVTLVSIKG